MASSSSFSNHSPLLILLPLAFVVAVTATAERFLVGDHQGWRQPDHNQADLYDRWAGAIRFHVGDSLYFNYTNDSVWVVNKTEYYHCNATHPIEAFDDGDTVFVLRKPGPLYFVSGDVEHCKNGQRLIVQVMALHPPKKPPPPPAAAAGGADEPAPPVMPPQPSAERSTSVSVAAPLLLSCRFLLQAGVSLCASFLQC